jgi:hypothetical protein
MVEVAFLDRSRAGKNQNNGIAVWTCESSRMAWWEHREPQVARLSHAVFTVSGEGVLVGWFGVVSDGCIPRWRRSLGLTSL